MTTGTAMSRKRKENDNAPQEEVSLRRSNHDDNVGAGGRRTVPATRNTRGSDYLRALAEEAEKRQHHDKENASESRRQPPQQQREQGGELVARRSTSSQPDQHQVQVGSRTSTTSELEMAAPASLVPRYAAMKDCTNDSSSSISDGYNGGDIITVGTINQQSTMMSGIMETCHKLFKVKKFFTRKPELEWTSSVAKFFYNELHVPNNDKVRVEWWGQHVEPIRKRINARRAAVCTAIKQRIKGKSSNNNHNNAINSSTGRTTNKRFSSIEELNDESIAVDGYYICLRTDPKKMMFFCENFVSCVIGKMEWKRNRSRMKFSSFVSPTDEAFALLAVENSILKGRRTTGEQMISNKQKGNRDEDDDCSSISSEEQQKHSASNVPPIRADGLRVKIRSKPVPGYYTRDRYKRTGKLGGWSSEGLFRFQELYLMVVEDRKDDKGRFDDYYYQTALEQARGGVSQDQLDSREPAFTVPDDLDTWAV